MPGEGSGLVLPHPLQTKRAAHPWLVAIGVGIAALILQVAACLLLFLQGQAAFKIETQQSLLRIVRASVTVLDVPLHQRLATADSAAEADYRAACAPLKKIMESGIGARFLYTAVLDQGKVCILLDPATPPKLTDGRIVRADLISPYDMGEYADAPDTIKVTLTKGVDIATEDQFTDQFGTFMSAFTPIRDAQGKQVGALGIDLDAGEYVAHLNAMHRALYLDLGLVLFLSLCVALVTWRLLHNRQAEERRRQQYLVTLDAAATRAVQAGQARQRFLDMISHELRTPLNGLGGALELLDHERVAEEDRELMQIARLSYRRMLAVVEDLLLCTSLLESLSPPLNRPLEIGPLVHQIITDWAAESRQVGQEVTVDCRIARPVQTDPQRLRPMIDHLIRNTIRHAKPGPVRVVIDHTGGDLVIAVTDSGPGIPAPQQARLFELFTQGSEGFTRTKEGLGLGLGLISGLARSMGGSVTLDSPPGAGATFTIRFPTALA